MSIVTKLYQNHQVERNGVELHGWMDVDSSMGNDLQLETILGAFKLFVVEIVKKLVMMHTETKKKKRKADKVVPVVHAVCDFIVKRLVKA